MDRLRQDDYERGLIPPESPDAVYTARGGEAFRSSPSQVARRGPKGYTRSDERIREDISETLLRCDDIDCGDVAIDVKDGRVTLEGTVPERFMKHAIEDIADACPGAVDIDNRIHVLRPEQRAG